jgi:hypothetical protein
MKLTTALKAACGIFVRNQQQMRKPGEQGSIPRDKYGCAGHRTRNACSFLERIKFRLGAQQRFIETTRTNLIETCGVGFANHLPQASAAQRRTRKLWGRTRDVTAQARLSLPSPELR